MIKGIHHTALSTPDLDRMLAFYRDLLGLEVVTEFAWPAGSELAASRPGPRSRRAR